MLRISDHSALIRPSQQKNALARMVSRYEDICVDIRTLRNLTHQIPPVQFSTCFLSEQEVDALAPHEALNYQIKRINDRFANYITMFPFSSPPECNPVTYRRIGDNLNCLKEHFSREGSWKRLIERSKQAATRAASEDAIPSPVAERFVNALDSLETNFQLFLNAGDYLRFPMHSSASHRVSTMEPRTSRRGR